MCANTNFALAILAVGLWAPALQAQQSANSHGKTDAEHYIATADAAWDTFFTRARGWTGGDVAGTVDLGDGRVLWLFGDSWIGEVADGRHKSGSQMVNNSIAIQSLAGKGTELPEKSKLHFYWQQNSKNPSAWIVPSPDAANGKKTSGWYWPTGGGIVLTGEHGERRLLIFLFHIGKQQGKEGVWAFKSLGGTMAIVDNVAERIENWKVRQFDIPFAVGSEAAKSNDKVREISWGVAACRAANLENPKHDWLYIYGVRNEAPLNRQVVLARTSIDTPERFTSWQFFSRGGKWSPAMDDLMPIGEHVTNELSVERLPGASHPTWIMVHGEPPLGRKILVRTASRPEGPWTDPQAVYSAPEVDRNRAYFAYAAKGHFQLSRPDELLITYLVNSQDFGAMAKDAGIYRPRFIRLPLKTVAPAR